MANVNDTFGFEAFHKLYHNEIQKKEDILILFVHWYLVKCGLRCIGIGDNNVFNMSDKGSELLPKEWNTGPSYALRYVKNNTLYLLCGIKSDDEILINLAKLDNDTISNTAFPIDKTVTTLDGSLETMIPSYEALLHQLRNEFLKPVCKLTLTDLENTVETATQTNTGEVVDFSLSSRIRNPRELDWRQPIQPVQRPPEPGTIGVSDLYPGGNGGGMIFDPFQRRTPADLHDPLGVPGRLPVGAVPPGARFDPFGPPDLDPIRPPRHRPGDDHMRPPRFFGDMFM
ncbi:Proteasome inhibitor PI31 subunit [Harpegnathos saltator]|uniref:Proteasome inhibitor PI31 subunit n=1 Tax=Harpegnathos saltator TaxID=610380 RepID=E2BWD8_HARSA|nr:Proteasome inhibitor PI31 subunit [Harpegnathos saltator]